MTKVAFAPRSAALRTVAFAFARKLRIEFRGMLMVCFDKIENDSSLFSSILNELGWNREKMCTRVMATSAPTFDIIGGKAVPRSHLSKPCQCFLSSNSFSRHFKKVREDDDVWLEAERDWVAEK